MKNFGIVLLIIGIISVAATCDRVINPFENEFGSFSIYTALDIGESENFIRIKNLTTPLLSDSTVGYDGVSLKFKDYTTGRTYQLEDTIVNFNGNYTFNYKVESNLEPDSEYNITLKYSEIDSISVDISTPGVTTTIADPDTVNTCFTEMNLKFNNVKRPEFIVAEVGVTYNEREYWTQIKTVQRPVYIEGEDAMDLDLSLNNLLVEAFPPIPETVAGIPPRFWRPTISCWDLDDYAIKIRYTHFGADWEPFFETSFIDLDFIEFTQEDFGLGFAGAIRKGQFLVWLEEPTSF